MRSLMSDINNALHPNDKFVNSTYFTNQVHGLSVSQKRCLKFSKWRSNITTTSQFTTGSCWEKQRQKSNKVEEIFQDFFPSEIGTDKSVILDKNINVWFTIRVLFQILITLVLYKLACVVSVHYIKLVSLKYLWNMVFLPAYQISKFSCFQSYT